MTVEYATWLSFTINVTFEFVEKAAQKVAP
jgi:hypothetical protein